MENNSESGLRIRQIISSVLILMLLASNIQLLVSTKEKKDIISSTKQTNEEIEEVILASAEIENEIPLATVNEREIDVTSRSVSERNVNEVNYKNINEIEISKNMDLTKRTGVSKEDFMKLMANLKVDTSGFFEKNSETIYNLCEKYELNEVFFCGLIAAESGWNITKGHRNKCNYISMMSKGKMIKFASPEEGLEAAAKLLHNKYLTPGGSYYRGKTLSSVQKIFCPDSSTWVGLVYGCMKQIVK